MEEREKYRSNSKERQYHRKYREDKKNELILFNSLSLMEKRRKIELKELDKLLKEEYRKKHFLLKELKKLEKNIVRLELKKEKCVV